MQMTLADPRTITTKAAEITRIGDRVNDPSLYHRIEQACLNRRAFLFVADAGFVVVKPVPGPGLLVWVAHADRPADQERYQAFIEQLASDIGGRFIRFLSNRRGFKRLAWRLGYVPAPGLWQGHPITIWTKTL